ncbi:MAG: 50S ribosomal protein L19 [Alphaproteobacteria bacterium MarineAlpha5_Bin11]|nr:50S ribosomal protein L19 [Pelagibacteraceae bacterium]PPR44000.1 MAG: 50S ribosomal protein L19 [Alphaproteobacteria bacterium MarineAlpha5_Bin11]PPR51221.1 MAG: 50S ribosomal protein L19 [Alphaproteobacteria bacterium MarineAlpha5_Bin10]|tara:strand:- start:1246 stop:1764 length:519 start_codon:yes stop_codon:yes gene_type:complete
MNNIDKIFEKEQIKKLTEKKSIPNFRSGDTLKVNVKVSEGDRSRIQAFEGVCIGRKNNGINSSFTVRKISHGEGVERVFPLFSSIVDSIEVIRQGKIRRAKLYYLRKRSGKSARIADKDRDDEKYQYTASENISENSQDEKVIKNESAASEKESVQTPSEDLDPSGSDEQKE